MLLENNFKEITSLFYNGQYEEGVKQLTTLIDQHPDNHMLYSNRALFNSQISEDQAAISDLERSLELHPLNYLAYFNLFSIQTKNSNNEEAFGNLCCSLSVMYLIRAKLSKCIKDAEQAIELAKNNIQARVLKSLLLASKGRLNSSKNELIQALQLNPNNLILRQLALEISKKIDPENVFQLPKLKADNSFNKRLRCEIKYADQSLYEDEIEEKVEQFNRLYRQLNDKNGGVTQKVPQQSSFSNNMDTYMLENSRTKRKKSNNSMINVLEDDDFFADEQNPSEHIGKGSDAIATTEPDHQGTTESEVKPFPEIQSKGIEIIEEDQEKNEISQEQPAFQKTKEKPSLYPLIAGSKLRMSVLNFSFYHPEEFINLQNVYSILTYNNGKEKMITNPVPCIESSCSWNKTFPDIQASPEPSSLKIKLYNKVFASLRDHFIGDFQVLINTADLLRLPLYDRREQQVGDLLLHLQVAVQ